MPAKPGAPARGAPARELILDAAERLFARRGFAATTIKQIAAAAGVNSALLYYYFRDKAAVYHAVLERRVQALVRGAVERLEAAGPPAARLRSFLEFQAETLASHPHLWPLMLRELVDHSARHVVGQLHLVNTAVFRRICALVEEGQRSGAFRAELDPRFAAISCVALILHFFTARPVVGVFLGYTTDGPPEDVIRAYARHAADLALAALAGPRPVPAGPRRKAARP